jgi:ubiquinone/menaquinone biosynthesis C-methylase UbiE
VSGPREQALAELQRSRDKYDCRNPIGRALLDRFVSHVEQLVASLAPARMLDVGCGDGRLTARIRSAVPGAAVVACDVSREAVAAAEERICGVQLLVASVYDLPFLDACFDVVGGFEVLEHLEDPERALREIRRVASGHVVLSVPHEPLWRLLNLLRGKYLTRLGNTPGHLQRWGPRAFRDLVATRFRVVSVTRPFPWTVAVGSRGSG